MSGITLSELLKKMIEMGGSDLHITTNSPPRVRVHGKLQPAGYGAADGGGHQGAGLQRADRRAEAPVRGKSGAGLLVRLEEPGALPRQPVSAARRGGRRLPDDSLGDQEFRRARACRWWSKGLCDKPRGLVLVTGPTGSGKSTTLAAMLDKINNEREEHMITIEDPIEFLHNHKNCLVNQREVHSDTHSFANSLRAALREDPDVVLIGEMRDLETIESALRIAETGPLDLRDAAHELRDLHHQPYRGRLSRPTSSRRFAPSFPWCSKASFASRCCRARTGAGA